MKRFAMLLLCLGTLVLILSACRTEYRQDLAPYELADHVERELSGGDFRVLDDQSAFYGGAFPLEKDATFALRVAKDGSNLNEFAVFACDDAESANALAKEIKDYLAFLFQTNREWYLSYIPAEVPKLQNAEVKTFGRYVAYAILSENDRNRVFDLLRQKLLQ